MKDSTALPPKEIVCDCGHRFTSQQRSNWCSACGKQVFYDPRDRSRGRFNSFYITALIVVTIGLLAYFFIEMILTPVIQNLTP